MRRLSFSVLDDTWAIVQLPPDNPPPAWLDLARTFVSVTRTSEELSVVCPESVVPAGVKAQPSCTFNTDYVLVRSDALPAALAVLHGAGHLLGS